MEKLKGKIGLEIHTYIITKQKLFCKCKASREKGLKANTNICPICTGQPGAKPMLPNKSAVEKAIQIGLMLNCKINKKFVWRRKHYDWPDLPKGYQNTISGSYAPSLGEKGKFEGIGIWSMHLEEDPASWEPSSGYVDYNRSGLPLVEIVTAPDFTNSVEVVNWLKDLIHNLGYLKIVDSNAGIKVDVNVSIPGKTERVEIKNINSMESIQKAIDYELERQMQEGSKRETRRYDELKGKTISMRSKEDSEDYRFIGDPDLMNIVVDDKIINSLKDKLPESPKKKLDKLIKDYRIDKKNAEILTKNLDIVEFYEKVAEKIDGQFALTWVTIELLRVLNYNKKKLYDVDIKVEHFVELLKLVKEGKITVLQGKKMINDFYPKSIMPKISANEGKIIDEKELGKWADKVMSENKKAVDDYIGGDANAFNFLMGKIMQETNRRADFAIARKVLQKNLDKKR